jgi:hypothetical protein
VAYPIIEARMYPPIGCGDHQTVKRRLDGRTRAARLLNGRSKPEGTEPTLGEAEETRPQVRVRKKASALTRSSDPHDMPSG